MRARLPQEFSDIFNVEGGVIRLVGALESPEQGIDLLVSNAQHLIDTTIRRLNLSYHTYITAEQLQILFGIFPGIMPENGGDVVVTVEYSGPWNVEQRSSIEYWHPALSRGDVIPYSNARRQYRQATIFESACQLPTILKRKRRINPILS